MSKGAMDLMAEYSVCPFCGRIFRESELKQVKEGVAKCDECGHKLILQHVNGLHEVFSDFLDDYPTRVHCMTENTINEMKHWFRKSFCDKETCYYDKPQMFVNVVWECMCYGFENGV